MPTLTVIYKAAKAQDLNEFLSPVQDLEGELQRAGYSLVDTDETSITMKKIFPDEESIDNAACKIERDFIGLREHFSGREDVKIPDDYNIFPLERNQDDTGTRITVFISPSSI